MPGQTATTFKNSQTNFVALDAGFIHSNNYNGYCVVLEGLDANARCYPIAVALVDGESIRNYEWFLKLVCRDLEIKAIFDNGKCILMSDRHKSIKRAVKNIIPQVIHRKCFLHIIRNIEQQKITVKEPLRRLLWDICLAKTSEEFYVKLFALQIPYEKCFNYLSLIEPLEYAMFIMYERGLCTYGKTTSNDVEQEMGR
jgi:hypothetical protein